MAVSETASTIKPTPPPSGEAARGTSPLHRNRETATPDSPVRFFEGTIERRTDGPSAVQAVSKPKQDIESDKAPRPQVGGLSLKRARSVLGMDVGARTIKLVHIHSTGSGLRVAGAAVFELPPPSDPNRFGAMARAVAGFVSRAKPGLRVARCALSGDGVATICSTMPRMPENELTEAMHWKLVEATSNRIDTAETGCHVLSTNEATGNIDIVAAAVPGDLGGVDTLFRSDRPRLGVVITAPLAAGTLLNTAFGTHDHSPVAMVDIGATSSRLSVVGPHGLEFTRSIPVGGDTITAALTGKMTIAEQMTDITREAAEQLKKQYRIGQREHVEAAGLVIPGSRILGAIRPALERLGTEIVRSLQFYTQSHNLRKVESVFICGGGAMLGGLAEYLTTETRIATRLLDPWRLLGIEVGPAVQLCPTLFAVATGAALHDGSQINLLPARVRAHRTVATIRTGALATTACAVLALVGLSWTAANQKAKLSNMLVQKQESTQSMERLAAKIATVNEYRTELARRQQLLNSLGVGRPLHAAVLKELSNIMPEGTYLRAVSFPESSGLRKVELDVEIYSMPHAGHILLKQRLLAALEESPFFANVSFAPANRQPAVQGRAADEALKLSCQLVGFPGG